MLIKLTGCRVVQLDQEIHIITASSILPWQFRKEVKICFLQIFKFGHCMNSKTIQNLIHHLHPPTFQ